MATSNIGLPPGTLLYKGPRRSHEPSIHRISYSLQDLERTSVQDISKDLPMDKIHWIDVDGIHETSLIEKFGKEFNLHPLLLEDVMDTNQRPSIDEHGEYTFLKLKMLTYNKSKGKVDIEQVSLVLGKQFVISFQEKPGDIFEPLRSRIQNSKGKIRNKGTDYLFYAIMDIIVDQYFTIMEEIGLEIAKIENEIYDDPDERILQKIQKNRKQLLTLRKSIYPMREVIAKVQKQSFPYIKQDSLKYFNDLYDNVIHIIDAIESFRDINSGLKDSYISSISLQMNKVMQVLTIISTIFIPITFLAGVYGMNFKVLPELEWQYGYGIFWLTSIVIAGSLIYFFRTKKWL